MPAIYKTIDKERLQKLAVKVLVIEAQAITTLSNNIGPEFSLACELLLNIRGRVVVAGMGKSGHIGKKLAATLASTGTPAFFMHPAEAMHGDLGMLTKEDAVIALSYSGEANEINFLIPLIKRLKVPLISFSGNNNSTLAKHATVHLNVKVEQEACPLGLAPTASSTAMLALGDALAIALLEARGFTAEDFARSHPGGRLGRRLLLKISDIMHKNNDIPFVLSGSKITEVLLEMSAKRLGFIIVVARDNKRQILGVFTDGDLRRTLEKKVDLANTAIDYVMTTKFRSITANSLAVDAVSILESAKITAIPVVDEENLLVGALNIHDLFKAGIL